VQNTLEPVPQQSGSVEVEQQIALLPEPQTSAVAQQLPPTQVVPLVQHVWFGAVPQTSLLAQQVVPPTQVWLLPQQTLPQTRGVAQQLVPTQDSVAVQHLGLVAVPQQRAGSQHKWLLVAT
jgi:hypothetical protein